MNGGVGSTAQVDGQAAAIGTVYGVVRNFDNALDVRHTAAQALARLRDPAAAAELRALAESYPDVLTHRVLVAAAQAAKSCEPLPTRGAVPIPSAAAGEGAAE